MENFHRPDDKRGRKILVADDAPSVRKMLRTMFEAEGCAVLEAADGGAGLKALESESADLIISDIVMPGMDGYLFCAKVKRNPQTAHIPFVIYTSNRICLEDQRLARHCGADLLIEKTISRKELISQINGLITYRERPVLKELSPEFQIVKGHGDLLMRKLNQKSEELAASERRIDELKLEINALCAEFGRPARYI